MSEVLPILHEITVWPLAIVGACAFTLGFLVARVGKSERISRRSITTDSGTFVEIDVYREAQKQKARLEQENQVFSEFFQILTDFTREMDGRLNRPMLPRRLLEIVDQIFLPGQILVFLADRNTGKLFLKESKGIAVDSSTAREVRIGEGKIGWVARHKATMDQEDFVREKRTGGENLDAPSHFRFKVDLCAPMLANNQQVQGVISVGGITRHPKFEKRLLATVADLGGIALLNHGLMEDRKKQANSDGLTGLINKRYLKDLLGEEIHRAEVNHHPLSLFIFDLDHFKKLNDSYGHLTGDRVLQGMAELLRGGKTIRDTDIAARWGGEEFLIILPGTPKEGALKAAEKVRDTLEKQLFEDDDGNPIIKVTLSGGIATFPEDGVQQTELVVAADKALYRAKKQGRNRVIRSDPNLFSAPGEEQPVEGGNAA
jgi:diguanylate cyclase (GGDEF)-like protein